MLTAVQFVVPTPDGVTTPEEVIVPLVAVQVTPGLKLPVPNTIAVQVAVCIVVIAEGDATTLTDVIVGGLVTITVALADFEVSCVDVAVMVAVPAEVGVKVPPVLTVPIFEGLTNQLTVLLKVPVPTTVCVHVVVWFMRIDVAEQVTATEVIVRTSAPLFAQPARNINRNIRPIGIDSIGFCSPTPGRALQQNERNRRRLRFIVAKGVASVSIRFTPCRTEAKSETQ